MVVKLIARYLRTCGGGPSIEEVETNPFKLYEIDLIIRLAFERGAVEVVVVPMEEVK